MLRKGTMIPLCAVLGWCCLFLRQAPAPLFFARAGAINPNPKPPSQGQEEDFILKNKREAQQAIDKDQALKKWAERNPPVLLLSRRLALGGGYNFSASIFPWRIWQA
jgi:hypothetical protein